MTDSPPKVSVLIPVYNGAAFVRTAIDSALGQRGVEVDVVVIDDGSTDDTPSILASYGPRIRVLRQQNSGHVVARNRGARIGTGAWFAFLDADDEWLPDKLRRQLAVAEGAPDIVMVYTDRENFGATERITRTASETYHLAEGDIFLELLERGNFVTVSSAIVRRDWFERLEGFDESLRVCEDWDMWLRLCAMDGRVGVVREPLTRYRWHSASMTMDHARMFEGRLKVVRKALGTERGRSVPRRSARKAVADAVRTAAWYALEDAPRQSLWWYLRAISYDPLQAEAYKGALKACLRLAGVRH